METIENSESESKVSFIACIIPAFADAYKMSVPNAYSYLKKYGGLNYLLDEWWALHTENILNAFVKDKKIDVDSASELFYSSKTFRDIADKDTELYKRDWEEIYKMFLTSCPQFLVSKNS